MGARILSAAPMPALNTWPRMWDKYAGPLKSINTIGIMKKKGIVMIAKSFARKPK
jgi:hypothetical protein